MMITVEACEETDIKIALEFLPADHVALASDWPHYDGTPELLDGFQKVADASRPPTRPRADARHRHPRELVPRALRHGRR